MKKEISPILLLIGAIIVTVILIPLGIVHNIGKTIYHTVTLKPNKAFRFFVIYWVKILYQLWNVCKYLITKIAVSLDLIWNATSGELIEDCVTAKEDTLFGNGNVTVSAATGNLQASNNLNRIGFWFSHFLSKVLGKNHCLNAWEHEKTFPINE